MSIIHVLSCTWQVPITPLMTRWTRFVGWKTCIGSPGDPNRLLPHAFHLQREVDHDLAFSINKIEFALAVFAYQYTSVIQWLTGQDFTLCLIFKEHFLFRVDDPNAALPFRFR